MSASRGQNVGGGRYRGRMSRYRPRPSPARRRPLCGATVPTPGTCGTCAWAAGIALASGPREDAGVCRALPSALRGQGGRAVAGRRQRDRPAQAIRDHDQAMQNYYAGHTAARPGAEAGRNEGFRVVHLKRRECAGSTARPVRCASRRPGAVPLVPAGAEDAKSFLVTCDLGACSAAWPAATPCNADVNAARNIAAGHAVTARGGFRVAGPANLCQPQPALLPSA